VRGRDRQTGSTGEVTWRDTQAGSPGERETYTDRFTR
jgi:hypothetical protein